MVFKEIEKLNYVFSLYPSTGEAQAKGINVEF